MKRVIQSVWILLSIALCLGCESLETEETEMELPDVSARLVLHSYMGNNDTAVLARVTASEPNHFFKWHRVRDRRYRGQMPRTLPLKDAEVWLYDLTDKRKVRLTFEENNDRYFYAKYSDFQIISGHAYRFKVRHAGFEDVSAQSTMPKEDDIRFMAWGRPDKGVLFEIGVASQPLRYFVVKAFARYSGNNDNKKNTSERAKALISSAESVDGTLRVLLFQHNSSAGLGDINFSWSHFLLYEVDANMYNYLQSSQQQRKSLGRESILSPPVMVHTNVENGYGVFGSMTLQASAVPE